MQALEGHTVILIKRKQGTPVLKGSAHLEFFNTKRFFSLNSLVGDENELQMKSNGGLCGCRRLTVSSKTGNTFGVLRSSFSLWGMSFIIEDGNGMPVFRVGQIGKFSFSEISFEVFGKKYW
ncbi:hypothetical protein Anas_10093 [Armadillidium nasatum]|uniref:Phospholipid scramblase n=1 Tax=Armadillidium nasatum TaxID=96803 RepID=A0A5N5SGX1_9CRUS|nr:hypothetical protein Anas_10093 [Armadillidium nasatum]